jgi:nucleotide-binding universal stress UspA family protein
MYQGIAVGTDGSDTAAEAVRRAAGLAAGLDVPLHVISVYRPAAVLVGSAPPEMPLPAEVLAECDAAMAAEADRVVGDIVAGLREAGVRAIGHAVPGAPAQAIMTVAAAEGADLIVVGNRGMQGCRRLLGSVPNAIAHAAHCDVLIVATT